MQIFYASNVRNAFCVAVSLGHTSVNVQNLFQQVKRTHTRVCVCVQSHKHTCTRARMHTQTVPQTDSDNGMRVHTQTHSQSKHKRAHTQSHKYTPMQAHTASQTLACKHTKTHTRANIFGTADSETFHVGTINNIFMLQITLMKG